jgi:hypothetical protein
VSGNPDQPFEARSDSDEASVARWEEARDFAKFKRGFRDAQELASPQFEALAARIPYPSRPAVYEVIRR